MLATKFLIASAWSGQKPQSSASDTNAIIVVYSHNSTLSKSERTLLQSRRPKSTEQFLNAQQEFVWIKIDDKKPWYMVTSLSQESFEKKELPKIAKFIMKSGRAVRLSDLGAAEMKLLSSQLALAPHPFFGPNTPLHSDAVISASCDINGKKLDITVSSKSFGTSNIDSVAEFYSNEQWSQLIRNGEAERRTQGESARSSVFNFDKFISLSEKSQCLIRAASSLELLIEKRNRTVAKSLLEDFDGLLPDFADRIGGGIEVNELPDRIQRDIVNQLGRSGLFENRAAASDWLKTHPTLKLSMMITIGVGGMGLGQSFP